MSSSDVSRGSKGESSSNRDRDWKPQRDPAPSSGSGTLSASQASPQTSGVGSLRSRISDEDPSRSLPQAPASSYRPEDDDRDSARKRMVSGTSNISYAIA
jgi:hypothetical protein